MTVLLMQIGIVILLIALWIGFQYLRLRSSAKLLSNLEFEDLMRQGQVVDVREPAVFRQNHILGARNIPHYQFKESVSALRKDKPVLLYSGDTATRLIPQASYLKKRGYGPIYVLNGGFNQWTGKTKSL